MDDQSKVESELDSQNFNIKEQFTTVTPLSKFLTMTLLVALPFVGFYLGRVSVPEAESVVISNSTETVSTVEPVIVKDESLTAEVEENINLSSLTVKSLPVISLSEGGTYLDFNATSNKYISTDIFGGLKNVSDNVYSDNKNTYLLEEIINDCTDAVENKLIKLEVPNISTLKTNPIDSTFFDRIIIGSNFAIIDFLKVEADGASFEYLGDMYYYGSPLENWSLHLFRDKDKVFLIKDESDLCEGRRLTDMTNGSDFSNIDIATFEYLGTNPSEFIDSNKSFAKDKNYFYWYKGILSKDVTPITCTGDFFSDCFAKIESLQGYYMPEEILSNIVKKVITQEFKDESSLECLTIKNEDQGDFRIFNVTKIFNSTCPGDVSSTPTIPTFKINRMNGDVFVMTLDGSYNASLFNYY